MFFEFNYNHVDACNIQFKITIDGKTYNFDRVYWWPITIEINPDCSSYFGPGFWKLVEWPDNFPHEYKTEALELIGKEMRILQPDIR